MTSAAVAATDPVDPPNDEAPAPAQPTLTEAVSEPERIAAIDVARGVAIFGIAMVNIQFFAQPFGTILNMEPPPGAGPLDRLVYYFTAIFFSGKFYPLFSTLFGIGFAIQFGRARAAGRRFAGPYLRRLVALSLMGLVHGFLFWYGDILFLYSLCGLVLFAALMIFPEAGWRSLVVTGVAIVLFAVLLNAGFGALMMAAAGEEGMPDTSPASVAQAESEAEAATSPIRRLFEAFDEEEGVSGPNDPLWMALEERAYREGPFIESLAFRALTYFFGIVFMFTGFGWHVLGMFFIGAGLMRARFFEADRRALHIRLLVAGLVIGLPLSAAGALLPGAADNAWLMMAAGAMIMLGGPVVSLAYLSAITLLVRSGTARPLTAAVASVGRMALTCYLGTTLIATFVMYHWGLGLFGRMSPVQQVGIVVGIYLLLLGVANAWLRFFQFGPLEWLWRLVTYLKPQPLLRSRA